MFDQCEATRCSGSAMTAPRILWSHVFLAAVGFVGVATAQSMLFRYDGSTASGQLGTSVAAVGDVDGDGRADIVVGAPYEDDNLLGDSGTVRVLSGRDGAVLFTWYGESAGDRFGFSVAGAGDVDGDGYPDVVVGAPQDDNTASNAGSARVLSGRTGLPLYTFNGDSTEDWFGFAVSGAGDIDADGFADIVVGSYRDDNTGTNAGSARVFSGQTGVALYTFNGTSPDDYLGWAVGGLGDINADGHDDLLVAEPRSDAVATRSGRVWVFSGEWITKTAAAQTPLTARVLRTFDGDSSGFQLGLAVAGGGDIDGDGVPDVIAGAPLADVTGTDAGVVRIYSGATGAVLRTLNGAAAGDHFGESVGNAGDVNGDGRADVIIGAPFHGAAGVDAGRAVLLSGLDFSVLSTFDGEATGDRCGQAVSGVGDVAGSGRTGVAVASPFADRGVADSGTVRVFADDTPSEPRDVVLLDVDDDGDRDVVTANFGTDDLSVQTNDGAGALGVARRIALGSSNVGPVALAAGDLDNDGARDDLAVACADSHTVVLVTDTGGATPTVVSLAATGMHPVDVAVLDLDADPRDDVVVAFEGTPFGSGDGIAVSLDGGAFAAVTIPAPYPRKAVRLAHGDLDGDGDQDLAVLAQGGADQILLFTGAGDGSLTLVGGIALPTGGLARGLCCGDLDGDGDLDLAVVLPTLFPTLSTDLRIYLYTPNGALDPTDFTPTADFPTSGAFGIDVASGDVDDDGLSDLAVVHAGSGDVALLRGFDGASFASTEAPTVGTGPIAITAGDLDGDGGDDFVVANQQSGDLSVLSFAQTALAQPYGTGCAGTGGLVPQIAGIDLPVQPSATFGVQLADARPFAPALLLFTGDPDDLDLGGGCTMLIALPAASTLRFTDGLGADAFVFGVPASPALLGFDLYFQYAVFDPAGAFTGILALSNGLRVQVGS